MTTHIGRGGRAARITAGLVLSFGVAAQAPAQLITLVNIGRTGTATANGSPNTTSNPPAGSDQFGYSTCGSPPGYVVVSSNGNMSSLTCGHFADANGSASARVQDDCSGGLPGSLSLNGTASADAAVYSPDTSCAGSGSSQAHGSFVLHLSAPAKLTYHVDASMVYRVVLPGGPGGGSVAASITGPAGLVASAGVNATGDNYPGVGQTQDGTYCAAPGDYEVLVTGSLNSSASAGGVNCGFFSGQSSGGSMQAHASITFSPYAAAAVTTPPADVHTCPSGSAAFSVTGSGAAPLTHQWQINSGGWTNLADGPLMVGAVQAAVISGSATPNLSLSQLGSFNQAFPGGSVQVRCVVSNDCSAASSPATLTVCRADADCNGRVEPADVAVFVSTWFTSLQQGTLAGDFDGNGAVEPADVGGFITTWFAALSGGC